MRRLGGSSALIVAALTFALPAAAEEPSPQSASAPSDTASNACDAHPACRIAATILSRLVDMERAALVHAAERYKSVVDAAKAVEEPEAEAFEARMDRFRRFQEFNRKLADEQAARDVPEGALFEAKVARYRKFQEFNQKLAEERALRETQEFEAEVALVRRKIAFMKRLESR